MKTKTIGILSLTAVMLVMVMTVPAMAATYEINTLHNWGVILNDSGVGLSSSDWIPDSPTADYVVEDNMDAQWSGDDEFEPSSYIGYHENSQDSTWKEPKIQVKGGGECIQPSGARYTAASREENDIEAFYFDRDATNAYFAIIVSKPLSEMGDLALDIDGNPGYEYGIILQNHDLLAQGDVYSVTSWDAFYIEPYRVAVGTKAGIATVSIVNSGVPDYGRANHVIEISVPRSALGSPSSDQLSNLHATISCGNDEIEIEGVSWEEIPEFATIAIPVGIIFGLFYFYRRKRQSKEE